MNHFVKLFTIKLIYKYPHVIKGEMIWQVIK
jgi:hypothetical protein